MFPAKTEQEQTGTLLKWMNDTFKWKLNISLGFCISPVILATLKSWVLKYFWCQPTFSKCPFWIARCSQGCSRNRLITINPVILKCCTPLIFTALTHWPISLSPKKNQEIRVFSMLAFLKLIWSCQAGWPIFSGLNWFTACEGAKRGKTVVSCLTWF